MADSETLTRPETFDRFLDDREAAAKAYVTGNPGPVRALSAATGEATFFDPGGGLTEGAEAVNEANDKGSRRFGAGGTTHLDIRHKAEADGLAFWSGYQIAEVEMDGKRVPMKIRVTEVFRRDDDAWKMIHRHASMAKDRD